MVNKIKHMWKGYGYHCELCGFVYENITGARNCESFCRKNSRFSLENVGKAIGRIDSRAPNVR